MENVSVLLTDDSEMDRYIYKRLLRSEWSDLRIFEMENGVHALNYLVDFSKNNQNNSHSPPAVILLDINMHAMNGFEFLKEFAKLQRDDARLESVSVIMLSSSQRADDIEKTTIYDCVKKYLVKDDISGSTLVDCLRPYLALGT